MSTESSLLATVEQAVIVSRHASRRAFLHGLWLGASIVGYLWLVVHLTR